MVSTRSPRVPDTVEGLATSRKARRAKSETFRESDRVCSPHRNAYNCAVRWEKRKPVTEPGTSAAWRSFSAMAARSTSSLLSAQSAGTNVVLYREYKLRPELVETGNACALPYTVTRICLLPLLEAVPRSPGKRSSVDTRRITDQHCTKIPPIESITMTQANSF